MSIDGWKTVGSAWVVERATGLPTEIIIEKQKTEDKQKSFRAVIYHERGKTIIGEIALDRMRIRHNGKFGSQFTEDWQPIFRPHFDYYGPADSDGKKRNLYSSKILVNFLESEGKGLYRGIGTVLMQVAIETSFCTGCGGRLILASIEGATGFYFRLGMRAWQSTTLLSQKMDEEIALGKSPLTDMYLPTEAIDEWKEKIFRSPILHRTCKKIFTFIQDMISLRMDPVPVNSMG